MEWFIWAVLYSLIGLLTSVPITRYSYRKALKENKNPIPEVQKKNKTPEQIDEMETQRRKKLSTEALSVGFWIGIVWPVAFVCFTVLFIIGLGMKVSYILTIKPEDKDFVTEKELRKAQAVVDRYHAEQRDQFEKELGE